MPEYALITIQLSFKSGNANNGSTFMLFIGEVIMGMVMVMVLVIHW